MFTKIAFHSERLYKSLLISAACLFIYMLSNYLAVNLFNIHISEWSLLAYVFLFISYVVTIYTVSLLFKQLQMPYRARGISLFFYFLFLTGGIQATVHTVLQTGERMGALLSVSVFISFVTAFMIMCLFDFSGESHEKYKEQIKTYFNQRDPLNWIARVVCGGFFLFITYYLINSMVSPFMEPYYGSYSHDFLVEVKNVEAVKRISMMLQAGMMVLGFIPLFALWKGSKSSLLLWFGFPLFIAVALQPFLFYFQWPFGFRFPMFIQMTLIMYIQSIIVVHLFYMPAGSTDDDYSWETAWL